MEEDLILEEGGYHQIGVRVLDRNRLVLYNNLVVIINQVFHEEYFNPF